MKYGTLGTISHGTLRTEDLLLSLGNELASLATPDDDEIRRKDALNLVEEAESVEDFDTEEADELVGQLIDALTEYAPPYCYFGAHEGDGSDFGFWPMMDAIEDDCRDGTAVKVSDLSEVPEDFTGDNVIIVNDHGNVTVYQRENAWREAWSCV